MSRRPPNNEPTITSYRKILEQQIKAGLAELERPSLGLAISGLSAGFDISVSTMLMAVALTLGRPSVPHPLMEAIMAVVYSAGFVLVVLGRSELFTEHTTLAVFPVLDRQTSVGRLFRLWGIVLAGNLVGVAASAGLIAWLGPRLGIIAPDSLGTIAHGLLDHPDSVIVVSAIVAGWLMGLLSWLISAARETISQIVLIILVTAGIGICHLHHSVVASADLLTAVFMGQVPFSVYPPVLGLMVVGNAIGGTFFVAVLKYGHALHAGQEPEDVQLENSAVQQETEGEQPRRPDDKTLPKR